MLRLNIPDIELFDDNSEEFFIVKGRNLQLEHSLVSLSKWEAKWNKPFLSKDNRTSEETLDYIRCMTITQNINEDFYQYIPGKYINLITEYIDQPMTATTITRKGKGGQKEIVTAELIYYWMIALNIPFECQKWHLNRLLTLINVCDIKNSPSKKMSNRDVLNRNRTLNQARRNRLKTRG